MGALEELEGLEVFKADENWRTSSQHLDQHVGEMLDEPVGTICSVRKYFANIFSSSRKNISPSVSLGKQ